MSKRGEFLKACTDRHFTYDTIMEYVDRLNSVPPDQREAQAELLTAEIEKEYPQKADAARILAELEDEPAQR